MALRKNSEMIGGISEESEQIIVEANELYFFRPKYNRGGNCEGQWVFKAIEGKQDTVSCKLFQTKQPQSK